ncbi:FtsK/SpoIIIE domain-containing protein [Clostridium baratii]
MRKMGNVVGDVDELRRQREARMNPPEYEAGQGDENDWDFFNEGGSNNMDESAFGGSNQGSGADFGGIGGDMSSLGGSVQGGFSNGQQMGNATSAEDKIFDGMVSAGKHAYKGGKELFNGINSGIRGNDALYWTIYGKKVMFTGMWITGGGFILSILGIFTSLQNGFWVMIGGMLTLAVGVLVFCLNCEKAREISENPPPKEELPQEDENIWGEDEGFDEECEEDNGWGNFSEEEEEVAEEDEYDPWSSIDESAYSPEVSPVSDEPVDIDSAIDSIKDIPAHTQTRQYLYEEFSRVLPIINPDFAKLKQISENSDEFIIFDKILRDASIQVGTNEEKIPELLELRENQFIIQIKATRPSGLKEEDIANEIANIYSRDEYGGILHEGVYATTSSVGGSYIINIFKGENSIITLADTYREVSDFVLNPKVKKPVIMGVNELGRVWSFDAEKVFSYIISGKPRSGKSWSVVSLVLQLSMYSSPREVNFEVFDVKGTSSDYYSMKDYIPHFKRFESNGKRILSRLRHLVTAEAERRKKILEANNVIAIADLKEKGVDVDIPYLYVLIDEIVGLIGTFSKEEHTEFKDLMNVLITQMPNLGIRLILVPHRVTNDIVPKTTYTNVGCIACVRSDTK